MSDISNFIRKFNNNEVDIVAAPAYAFKPLEIYKGLGSQSGMIAENCDLYLRASPQPVRVVAKQALGRVIDKMVPGGGRTGPEDKSYKHKDRSVLYGPGSLKVSRCRSQYIYVIGQRHDLIKNALCHFRCKECRSREHDRSRLPRYPSY